MAVIDKRPKGVLAVGWACFECAATGRPEHRPTSVDYPDEVVRRFPFKAGGGLGWTLSALTSPRSEAAPWKIVVITGSPSWAEYWAPVLAQLPQNREMIVVDRPGFACSEPETCVLDLTVQACALAPLLATRRGQKLLLVGQSYGAAIATLMARASARTLGGLVLLSSYLGEPGPTARWLVSAGSRMGALIPRDLRNAVMEISHQPRQLALMRDALPQLKAPIHAIHGEEDDFAPIEAARRLAEEARTRRPIRFVPTPGANHFLNDGPAEMVIEILESCIPAPRKSFSLSWPRLTPPLPATRALRVT
ncbi:MAG TPA: alpha/beta hydrolase [Caulobacteraceae bacterium]|jgi:pimeloyl-ACP methyl ester carboxylesterase